MGVPIRTIFTRDSQVGLRALFLVLVAITFMVMDKRLNSFVGLRTAFSWPLATFQHVINWPNRVYHRVQNVVVTHQHLVEENLRLKTDRLLLRSQLQRLLAIESENNYLKSLLQSSQQVKGKTLIAELLAVAAEPFVNQVILDKGSHSGVYLGQPVLDASGVMGQVMEVGVLTSRVLLINDPHSGVAVQNVRNGMRAVAVGDSDTNKLRLMYVAKTADIRVGDIFITSGLGDRYPAGFPVGKVASIRKNPAQPFATIIIQPSAQLNSSRQVLLIWYQRNA